jgi:predicted DNA-binding ribbon-helix-helix protein
MRKRSIVVDGHSTSITLEDAFWDELAGIARERGVSLNALVSEIDQGLGGSGNLSSALRLHVLQALKRRLNRG